MGETACACGFPGPFPFPHIELNWLLPAVCLERMDRERDRASSSVCLQEGVPQATLFPVSISNHCCLAKGPCDSFFPLGAHRAPLFLLQRGPSGCLAPSSPLLPATASLGRPPAKTNVSFPVAKHFSRKRVRRIMQEKLLSRGRRKFRPLSLILFLRVREILLY